MASNSELYLMTQLLNLGRVRVIDYRIIEGIGIFLSLENTNYYVILVDLEKKKVIGMIEKRTKKEITEYLEAWGAKVLSKIQEVSIDLWKTYKSIAEELMPQAEVVADRFHVMKQVTDELDSARRKIKRETEKIKSKSKKEKILSGLKKSKYVLLKNEKDLNEDEKAKLKKVEKVAPALTKMHTLKEELRDIFENRKDWREGLLSLADWLKDISDYFPKSFGTIKRWIGEIIAYFDEGTTQGIVEGINNKLKLIKRRAFGFRNFNNFQLISLLTWHFAS